MRILQLIYSLDYGGLEQMVASLAVCQSRSSHSVRVACLCELGPQPLGLSTLAAAGVEVLTFDKPPGFCFETLRKLAVYLKDQRIDVIHTHNHLVHHYGAVAGRLAGCPAILNTLDGTATLQMHPLAKALFWFSCVISDKIVCVCPQVHEVFRKTFRLPDKKLCVIDNGIDLSPFLEIPRYPLGDAVTFGNIGRLDQVKDQQGLLRAFAILRKTHPHARLRLLGDGVLRSDLECLTKDLAITENVIFEGFSSDTARFLSSIDIYVISSRSEGLPLTLLEAMGAALPVVATAVGGVPDILGNAQGGWLCPPCNPNELAKAMEKALLSPDLGIVGAQNRKAAQEHYSVERMTRDYDHLYKQLLFGH